MLVKIVFLISRFFSSNNVFQTSLGCKKWVVITRNLLSLNQNFIISTENAVFRKYKDKNNHVSPKCKTANCVQFDIILNKNNLNYLKKHAGIEKQMFSLQG